MTTLDLSYYNAIEAHEVTVNWSLGEKHVWCLTRSPGSEKRKAFQISARKMFRFLAREKSQKISDRQVINEFSTEEPQKRSAVKAERLLYLNIAEIQTQKEELLFKMMRRAWQIENWKIMFCRVALDNGLLDTGYWIPVLGIFRGLAHARQPPFMRSSYRPRSGESVDATEDAPPSCKWPLPSRLTVPNGHLDKSQCSFARNMLPFLVRQHAAINH